MRVSQRRLIVRRDALNKYLMHEPEVSACKAREYCALSDTSEDRHYLGFSLTVSSRERNTVEVVWPLELQIATVSETWQKLNTPEIPLAGNT